MARRFDPADIPAQPDLRFETALWGAGFVYPAGLDEAGRGAWAGPVSAGAVILPRDPHLVERLHAVRDSKQMLPRQRDYWAKEIKAAACAWGVGFASSQEIDQLGIVPATRLSMQRALEGANLPSDYLLVDALRLIDNPLPQTSLIKGDARSLSIAAASILAKTSRDAFMVELEETYPGYGFAHHKGYGTAVHSQALANLGPCPMHRVSFAPIQALQSTIESD
jgi:ribonuclease HII